MMTLALNMMTFDSFVDYDVLYAAGREAFGPDVMLGGGSATQFTELNRRSQYGMPINALDFVTHSTSAVVHDAGDVAVMQTLEALPYVTQTCRKMIDSGAAGKPVQYIINPSAIGVRGNPFGDRPNHADVRMPMANADPRSRAMFGMTSIDAVCFVYTCRRLIDLSLIAGAAYFVGYVASLGLQDGTIVDAVALGDAMGDRGLLSAEGEPYPTYHVVQVTICI